MIARDLDLILQVDIHLDTEEQDITYTNCDVITGTVDLTVLEKVSLRNLKVKLVTRTLVAFFCEHEGITEREESVEEKLIVAAHLLPNISTKNGEYENGEILFERGVYYYPFAIRIPMVKRCKHCNEVNELMPLFELGGVSSVDYFIRVSIDARMVNRYRVYKHLRFMPLHSGTKVRREKCTSSPINESFNYTLSDGELMADVHDNLDFLTDSDSLQSPATGVQPPWAFSSESPSTMDGDLLGFMVRGSGRHPVDVATYVKASLDEWEVVPSRAIPLRFYVGSGQESLDAESCSVFLQNLSVDLHVYTQLLVIGAQQMADWKTVHYYIPLHRAHLQNSEFCLSRAGALQFHIDGEVIEPPFGCSSPRYLNDDVVIPPDMVPSFHSCKFQRFYSLVVDADFTRQPCHNEQEMRDSVQKLKFVFDDLQIRSGRFQERR